MKKKLNIYLIAVFVLISAVSCYTYNKTTPKPKNKNLAYIYNPHSRTVNLEYFVNHIDDENSIIHVRIKSSELFFVKSTVSDGQFADIKFKYRVYNSSTNKQIVDSASLILNFRKDLIGDTIEIELPLKIKRDSSYSAKVIFTDVNRERTETDYIFIDKKSRYTTQNFLIENITDNKIIFDRIIKANVKYKIENKRVKQKEFTVFYYPSEFFPALLPFSTQVRNIDLNPDSIFLITNELSIDKNGLFLIRADSNIAKGISVLNFTPNYPELKTPEELLYPLKYITSSSEFKKMKNNSSKKLAVDKFWLNVTGNKNRARELIKIFYTRVKLSNIYFTSYKEGWKTDRGMIFTVFGAPTIVYKSDKYEKWIYGENQTNSGLIFLFEKKEKFFSDADYELHRNQVYKTTWYQAVDVWRNGRAFTVVN